MRKPAVCRLHHHRNPRISVDQPPGIGCCHAHRVGLRTTICLGGRRRWTPTPVRRLARASIAARPWTPRARPPAANPALFRPEA